MAGKIGFGQAVILGVGLGLGFAVAAFIVGLVAE